MSVPVRIMKEVVIPDSVKRTILNRLKAAAPDPADAGIFNGAKVGLFKGDFQPSRTMVLADITATVANFDGYALSSAVTFGNALTDDNGNSGCIGPSVQFTANGATTPNTVTGAYLVDGAGTLLLCACRFDESVTVNHSGDGLVVVPQFDWTNLIE